MLTKAAVSWVMTDQQYLINVLEKCVIVIESFNLRLRL